MKSPTVNLYLQRLNVIISQRTRRPWATVWMSVKTKDFPHRMEEGWSQTWSDCSLVLKTHVKVGPDGEG